MKNVLSKVDLATYAFWLAKNESEFTDSTWVKLKDLPSPYSFDEALLICKHSEQYWLAWIPDFGEITLHHSQFEQIIS